MNDFKIGMYIRVSKEDNNKNEFSDESESIINQKSLIQNYIRSNSSFTDCKVYEFVDDGFRGTNFERPKFKELMEQVKKGKINCIIVKDLSRFGRNYIEIGNYMEQIFPFLGVRFIAINDNYDSATCKWLDSNYNIAMKNMIYDFYSKDLSVKVKTARLVYQKKGFFFGSMPTYGLQKDSNQKNKLTIDEEAAVIVRKVFKLALEGKQPREIAFILNKEKIPTPAQYYLNKNSSTKRFKNLNTCVAWDENKVIRILRQEMYYGAVVGHKQELISPCNKKRRRVPKDEIIIVENMHEAIISKEDWLKAQDSIHKAKKRSTIGTREYLFKGKLKCGYCNRALCYVEAKKVPYLKCKYAANGANENCFKIKVIISELEVVVWNTLQKLFANIDEIEKQAIREKNINILDNINILNRDLQNKETLFFSLIEKLNNGIISKEEFLKQKEKTKLEMNELSSNIDILREEAISEQNFEADGLLDNIKKYCKQEQLSQEMIETFIDMIIVYDNQNFEIKWKFSNEFFYRYSF